MFSDVQLSCATARAGTPVGGDRQRRIRGPRRNIHTQCLAALADPSYGAWRNVEKSEYVVPKKNHFGLPQFQVPPAKRNG